MPFLTHVWPTTVLTAWVLLPLDQLASPQSWWPWQAVCSCPVSAAGNVATWPMKTVSEHIWHLSWDLFSCGSVLLAPPLTKPTHVCVPYVHLSQFALHKAPSLNLHPSKSVASFWSCTIISMHCPWFFFLLKSNCTFPEYSHQLCLFIFILHVALYYYYNSSNLSAS